MSRASFRFLVLAVALACCAAAASAQGMHHPFAVGADEGAVGPQSGFGAWLIGEESGFYQALTGAVRATRAGFAGAATLVALSFAYGIFHAAGPGHGKAVITSYMVSNEVALRRGLVIALFAALLQASVATGIVGIAAFVFHATAPKMTAAARTIEFFSYLCILVLGVFLCWRKGWALIASIWPEPAFSSMAFAGDAGEVEALARSAGTHSRFLADDGSTPHVHGLDCDCIHMPDPRTLASRRFDARAAALAVVTAGARPCSGAILVLVFALSQGIFAVGVGAAFAMALGTAATTGGLACAAVYAKGLAQRISGTATHRAAVVGRVVELLAALCVLIVGGTLFFTAISQMHALI